MDWDTLIAVVVGGLIGIATNYFTNRYQSKEHDKNRIEQKRELRIQLALDLLRRDIHTIEASIDGTLKSMNSVQVIRSKHMLGNISDDELIAEIDSLLTNPASKLHNLGEISSVGDKLAYTIGEEFYSEYSKFDDYWNSYIAFLRNPSSDMLHHNSEHYSDVISSAAKLHTMLNEKLISIRDTE